MKKTKRFINLLLIIGLLIPLLQDSPVVFADSIPPTDITTEGDTSIDSQQSAEDKQVNLTSLLWNNNSENADYYSREFQPNVLLYSDETSITLIEYGFRGFLDGRFAIGSKSPRTNKWYETFDPNLPEEYMDKLALIVPEKDAILDAPYIAPYKAPTVKAEQYLNLQLLVRPDPDYYIVPLSYQLCGFIATLALVGGTPPEFFNKVADETSWGRPYFSKADTGVGQEVIETMFEINDWNADTPSFNYHACNDLYGDDDLYSFKETSLCQLKLWMKQDYYVVTDGNLSTDKGVMIPLSYSESSTTKETPHWYVVLQIIDSHDGQSYVRVYNPFQNREEVYLWNDFYAFWVGREDGSINVIVKP